jgi:WD40 repeat protein
MPEMRRVTRKILIVAALLLVGVTTVIRIHAVALPRSPQRPVDDYQTFISQYSTGPLVDWFPSQDASNQNKQVRVEVAITAIVGDDRPNNNSSFSREATYGCRVSTDGRIGYFSTDSFDTRGTYGPAPAGSMDKVAAFVAIVPADGSSLPPPNRRVVLQINRGGGIDVRVYDRAQMPMAFLDLLRALNLAIEPAIPQFAASEQITRHDLADNYLGAISPGGQILNWNADRHYEIWDLRSRKRIREIVGANGLNPKQVAFSPDGRLVMIVDFMQARVFNIQTGNVELEIPIQLTPGNFYTSIILPHFLAGGHILSYLHDWPIDKSSRSRCELRCLYDTISWQKISKLPGIPEDALDSFDATSAGRSIVLLKTGDLVLWDTVNMRAIATLAQKVVAKGVRFSPDGAMVATITAHYQFGNWTNHRICVWRLSDGTLVQEFHWNGQTIWDDAVDVQWVGGSNDLVTLTNYGLGTHEYLAQIWNVRNGRALGTLTPLLTEPSGLTLLPGGRYMASSHTQVPESGVAIWDLPDVMNQLDKFQRALPALH